MNWWKALVIPALLMVGLHQSLASDLKYSQEELEFRWQSRIQSFLEKGVIPLVDLEASLRPEDRDRYLEEGLKAMDELGVAMIAYDGYQRPKIKGRKEKGYRWSDYILDLVNAHPDRFIPTTNGGTNKNWFRQKRSFLKQTEAAVRGGEYRLIGEIEFRHYMSSSECRKGRSDRDITIPVNSPNGHRLFALAAETGVAIPIHLEAEDQPLAELEEMLAEYPGAKVIWAHFGQIRHPEKQTRYGPELLRHLLASYPNLFIDLATGQPGRKYPCNGGNLDTVIWKDSGMNDQMGQLKPAYQKLLVDYSDRFVHASDYGGGRDETLAMHMRGKVNNTRLILRDLPVEAQHNIGYRNAWYLLTGRQWGQ